MDNSHETPVDESHAEVHFEDHTGNTPTEEEDATYDDNLDQLIEILPTKASQALKNMVAMPWKRPVALRPNKECKFEPAARRNCNQEAALCQTRGDIREEPCVSCDKGKGIFAQCIVVPGEFGGACGSCRYNRKQAKCSLCNCAFLHSISLSNHVTNACAYSASVENLKGQVEDLQKGRGSEVRQWTARQRDKDCEGNELRRVRAVSGTPGCCIHVGRAEQGYLIVKDQPTYVRSHLISTQPL